MSGGTIHTIEREQWLERPIEEVFAFFGDSMNLQAITPEWLHFSVLTPPPMAMAVGARIEYRLRWGVVPLRWVTLIEEWEPPRRFVDSQLEGPYRLWHHTHTFEPQAGGTIVRDTVRYQIPFGWLGATLHWQRIRRDLAAIFDERARRVRALLAPPARDDPSLRANRSEDRG